MTDSHHKHNRKSSSKVNGKYIPRTNKYTSTYEMQRFFFLIHSLDGCCKWNPTSTKIHQLKISLLTAHVTVQIKFVNTNDPTKHKNTQKKNSKNKMTECAKNMPWRMLKTNSDGWLELMNRLMRFRFNA